MGTVRDNRHIILLIEDDPNDIILFETALYSVNVNYQVISISNGSEAIEFIKNDPRIKDISIVFIDINIPGDDGHSVLDYIKTKSDHREVPVIMFSSSDAANDVSKSYELKANCHVKKPISFQSLGCVLKSFDDFWLKRASIPRDLKKVRSAV